MPETLPQVSEEQKIVFRWRYQEARRLGLTMLEARLFAESDSDLHQLRALRKNGCPARLAADILR